MTGFERRAASGYSLSGSANSYSSGLLSRATANQSPTAKTAASASSTHAAAVILGR